MSSPLVGAELGKVLIDHRDPGRRWVPQRKPAGAKHCLLSDPGHEARGFWVGVDHPEAGHLTYPGAPVLMSEVAWQTSRAPMLGEHNEAVYHGELGYPLRDLAELVENGIV